MVSFKPNDFAQVIDDKWVIGNYASIELAGEIVKIICKSTLDDAEGYEVEFVDKWNQTLTYFIKTEHLAPAPLSFKRSIKQRWEQVADVWQNKLWKEKEEK
jgi:hypothetical protein